MAVAILAGGSVPTAVRLGVAMIALQASIGTLNDLVDAPFDAGRKPGKPIPAGVVPATWARIVMVGAAGLGLGLSATSGPVLLSVAGLVLAVGYGYDLVAKGTAWSWLPFAIGIPLLPVFGWLGAAGELPASFAILLPMAIMAGAALAIANASADMDRDEAAGHTSVAIRLGSRSAWTVAALLEAAVATVALGSLWLAGASSLPMAGSIVAVLVLGTGLVLGRGSPAAQLERAWEVQAIAIALLAVAWLWGIAGFG